jgi:hypothetical protein
MKSAPNFSASARMLSATDPALLYREGFTDDFIDRPAAVVHFRRAFDALSERALDERASIDLIDGIIKY